MAKFTKYCVWGLTLFFAVISFVPFLFPLDQPKQGQVVARVNGEIITDRQVSLYIKQFQVNPQAAIQKLIDDKLILQAAIKSGIKVSRQEIDDGLKEQMTMMKTETIEKLQQQILDPMKISLEEYRQGITDSILRGKYINSKMGAPPLKKSTKIDFIINTFVSPREIKEYFFKHKDEPEFTEPLKIKTRQIILKFDSRTKSEQKTKAENIIREIAKGGDFDALAKQFSEIKADSGGDWDWTPKGSFPKEVEDIIYNLAIGAVSPVIKSGNTLQIVKVEDKTIPRELSVDDPEIQRKIRIILSHQKRTEGIKALKLKLVNEADIQMLRN